MPLARLIFHSGRIKGLCHAFKGPFPISPSYPLRLLHPYHAACQHSCPRNFVQETGTKPVPSCCISSKPLGHEVPQPRTEDTAGSASQLSPLQGRTSPLTHLSHTCSSSSAALPWAGMLQRAAGTPRAQHLPASLLLPTQCYSLYVSPNKLDKTSLRRLLEKP